MHGPSFQTFGKLHLLKEEHLIKCPPIIQSFEIRNEIEINIFLSRYIFDIFFQPYSSYSDKVIGHLSGNNEANVTH